MGIKKEYVAELIGTFALVLVGCGSAVIAGGEIGFLGISLAFGLTVTAMVYCIGPISGCHINPAITLAMVAAGRKMKPKDVFGYIVSQCLGAVLGAAVLLAIVKGKNSFFEVASLGQNGYATGSPDGYSLISCAIAEIVLTALFLFVIFGATSKKAPAGFAGIAIGFALVLIHLVGIPITGTSVNPARSIGPAVLLGGMALQQLWLFIVAPLIGALLAAFIWKNVIKES